MKYKPEIAENILETLLHLQGNIIFSIDKDYKYLAFNSDYRKYLKETFDKDVEIGDSILEIFKGFKDLEKEKSNFNRALSGVEFSQVGNYELKHKTYYFKDIYKPISDKLGNIIGVAVCYTNITERKKSERTWNVLLNILKKVNTIEKFEDFIFEIRIELSKLIDTRNFYVALYDETSDTYTFPYYVDEYDKIETIAPLKLKRSLTDYVRRTGAPLLITDKIRDELIQKKIIEVLGTISSSWIGVPLKTADKSLGVMVVQSYDKKNIYSEKDLEIMAFVSGHIAGAVDQKRIKSELKQTAERLQFAQKIAKVGHWEFDFNSKRIKLSKEAQVIFGIENDSWISIAKLQKFTHPDDIEKVKSIIKKINLGSSVFDAEFKIINSKSNQIIYLQTKADFRYNNNGTFLSANGIIQDITKQYHDKLELQAAKEKAEESDKLKSAFLANMSHEIRTPMNAITGFSKLMLEKDLTGETIKKYAEYINNSSDNLLKLINDILDVAKIEADQISFVRKPCFVNIVLKDLFSTFIQQKKTLGKEHIKFIVKKAIPNDDFAIITDPLRFRQILTNLIGNAIKFTETGYIEFGYTFLNSEQLNFYVKDTGIGIPPDKIDLIFSRFGQIIGNKIKNPGGTGLGLSISKYLVEALGGTIKVETNSSEGTTFSFTLDFIPVEVSEKENKKEYGTHLPDFSELSVLIVDDNKINQTLVADTLNLNPEKNTVHFADSGEEALEKAFSTKYDLIFMDIRMPGKDGYEVTKEIRLSEKPGERVPIIGLSAHAMKEAKDEGLLSGMDDFLTKPFTPKELFQIVNKFISYNEKIKNSDILINKKISYKYIDLSILNDLYRNNESKLRNIVQLSVENIDDLISNLNNFISNKKVEQAKISAHSLKSAFKYLGMESAAVYAREIEISIGISDDYIVPYKNILELWKNAREEAVFFINIKV